jgi:rhodanese-related sulfurtransferase
MGTQSTFRVIDLAALKAKIDQKGRKLQLWNVLPREYFKADENIPGSKWLPVDILEGTVDSVNVKKDDEIIVYCAGADCIASKKAFDILSKKGFKNLLLYEGGLKSWKASSLPLEKLPETPARA